MSPSRKTLKFLEWDFFYSLDALSNASLTVSRQWRQITWHSGMMFQRTYLYRTGFSAVDSCGNSSTQDICLSVSIPQPGSVTAGRTTGLPGHFCWRHRSGATCRDFSRHFTNCTCRNRNNMCTQTSTNTTIHHIWLSSHWNNSPPTSP